MEGFTAVNLKKKLVRFPREDSFSINIREGIISVADGITRDCENGAAARGGLKGAKDIFLHYPRPSPAEIASDIFVETFPLVLKDYFKINRDEIAIRNAFEEANNRVKLWNQKHIPNPDYLVNDFAGCVAAGTSKLSDIISFGYLTDSGVAIFDAKGNLKFRTENQGPDKFDKYIWEDERLKNIDWSNPEARKIIRKNYRNNPQEEHSFGVLTGEDSAMSYVRTGTQELDYGDSLIVYTDGLEPIIFSGECADKLRQRDVKGLEQLCKQKVATEGTLVYHLFS